MHFHNSSQYFTQSVTDGISYLFMQTAQKYQNCKQIDIDAKSLTARA